MCLGNSTKDKGTKDRKKEAEIWQVCSEHHPHINTEHALKRAGTLRIYAESMLCNKQRILATQGRAHGKALDQEQTSGKERETQPQPEE